MQRSFRKLAPVTGPSPALRSLASPSPFEQTPTDQPHACQSEADAP
jgi:hypothetical protein